MAKKKLLNVKAHLENLQQSIDWMLANNNKHEHGLRMPPAYVDNLNELSFINRAILKNHAEKKTRKDIYISARGDSKPNL